MSLQDVEFYPEDEQLEKFKKERELIAELRSLLFYSKERREEK